MKDGDRDSKPVRSWKEPSTESADSGLRTKHSKVDGTRPNMDGWVPLLALSALGYTVGLSATGYIDRGTLD